MRFIFAAIAALATFSVSAETVTLTWVNPTQYVGGSALPASAITRNRAEYGTCVGTAFGTKLGEFVSTGNDTTEVSPNLNPGTYCFRVYTTASGAESVASNVLSRTIVQPPPNPPTLTAISTMAFETRTKWGEYQVWREAGSIPYGTPCDAALRVPGTNYYAVSKGAVTPIRNRALSAVVVALCG